MHVGRAGNGQAVKVTASPALTIEAILAACRQAKGITVVGVVDCASPAVLADLDRLIAAGGLQELPGGGLAAEGVTLLLGAEVEIACPTGLSHHVGFLPSLSAMRDFSRFMSAHLTNPTLSSQRADLDVDALARGIADRGGFLVPAHVFTPFKSVFGRCARRLDELFSSEALAVVPAVELGLSSDADLADRFSELHRYSFVTNSDAHSTAKIGREYNVMQLERPDFASVGAALWRRPGGEILANYGLDPKLGKYHRTFCLACDRRTEGEAPTERCDRCGGTSIVRGVLDRIISVADTEPGFHPGFRPPYHYQVPLEFVPGVGPVARKRLLEAFRSEIAVLTASREALTDVVGARLANSVRDAQEGLLKVEPGAGGYYGKLLAT